MRSIIPLISFLLIAATLHAQPPQSADTLISRLYKEVRVYPEVQSRYIGCYGNLSTIYKKMDSLKKAVGLPAFLQYFNEPSVNLKYYAFVEMLAADDTRAFNELKALEATTDSITFEFAGQTRGEEKLGAVLTGEYLHFIRMKYYYGGIVVFEHRLYSFPPPNRRQWRKLRAQAAQHIAANGLNEKWINDHFR